MNETVLVAGATGNLGKRICRALQSKGAGVRALVRADSKSKDREKLRQMGVELYEVRNFTQAELEKACTGVVCVVSALQGLRNVLIDAQTALLNAAVAAGVPRFIPSDYSLDFTQLMPGTNRNFDIRREFHRVLDKTAIAATSVFNGTFADILGYNTPILNLENKSVGYWDDKRSWHIDFTTMDDVAAFTAAAALDATAPRYLRVASFQVSPQEILKIASEAALTAFTFIDMGTLTDFAAYNKFEREKNPDSENDLFPRWQTGQYMHDMFTVHHEALDTNRYADVQCTNAEDYIRSVVSKD